MKEDFGVFHHPLQKRSGFTRRDLTEIGHFTASNLAVFI